MICCVIWTASGQQTKTDSIVITDDEYRMFRISQESLKECLTVQDLKDTQYKNATNIILLKDSQIKDEQNKVLLTAEITNTVKQSLLLSQSETKTYKKELLKWKFYTFGIGLTGIISTVYFIARP